MFEGMRNFSKIPGRFLSKKTGAWGGFGVSLTSLAPEAAAGLGLIGKVNGGMVL